MITAKTYFSIKLPRHFIFLFFFSLNISLLYSQGTCLSCKGSGTVSVRKRIPVEKQTTYSYLGTLTKTYTNVVYGDRYITSVCHACNGTGNQPMRNQNKVRKAKKPTIPPATLDHNMKSVFGHGYELESTGSNLGKYYLVKIALALGKKKYAVIKLIGSNQFQVLLDDCEYITKIKDELYQTYALKVKKEKDRNIYLYNLEGKPIYSNQNDFLPITKSGDLWVKSGITKKIGEESHTIWEMQNFKSGINNNNLLNYGSAIDCNCQELWSKKKMIDIRAPHVYKPNEYGVGIVNASGEILVPPIYKKVLDCDAYSGEIIMVDEYNFIYRFDHLGRLLVKTKLNENENCSDDIALNKNSAEWLEKINYDDNTFQSKFVNQVVVQAPGKSIDKAVFKSIDCFNDKGWAKAQNIFSYYTHLQHTDGLAVMPSEYYLKNGKSNYHLKQFIQTEDSSMKNDWYKITQKDDLMGALYMFKESKTETKTLTIKPKYRQILPTTDKSLLVKDKKDKWGIYDRKKILKPQFEQLYYNTRHSYLGKKDNDIFFIDYDSKFRFRIRNVNEMRSTEDLKDRFDFVSRNKNLPSWLYSAFIEKDFKLKYISKVEKLNIDHRINLKNELYLIEHNNISYLAYHKQKRTKWIKLPKDITSIESPIKIKRDFLVPVQINNGKWMLFTDTNHLVEDEEFIFYECL